MRRLAYVLAMVFTVSLRLGTCAEERRDCHAATALTQHRSEKIAFLSEDGLYTINPDGTGLARIGGREYMPFGWSTDRESIYLTRYYDCKDPELYERAKWDAAVIGADGANLRELVGRGFLSPDGKLRVFEEGEGSIRPSKVYIESADGTGKRLLTPGTPEYGPGEFRMSPCWSDDGSKVCYLAGYPFEGFDIYLVTPDGSLPRACTRGRPCEMLIRCNPCEDKIAFSSTKEGNREIYVIDADGKNEINLSKHPADEGGWFDWSPDGKRAVFTSQRDGDWELYVVNVDGTGLRQLTFNDIEDTCPVWNSVRVLPEDIPPSGASAAGLRRSDEAKSALAAASPQARTPASTPGVILRPLTEGPLCYPDWSPDGRFLAATCVSEDDLPTVAIVNASSGDSVRSFSGGSPTWDPATPATAKEWGTIFCHGEGERAGLYSYTVGSAGVVGTRICDHGWAPAPSPDGKKLLFGPGPGKPGLFVLSIPTAAETEVNGASAPFLATWSPDGNQIAYSLPAGPPERRGVYLVPGAGGTSALWLHGGDAPSWSPQGDRIACVLGEELCLASYPAREITSLSRSAPFVGLAWSPDGRWLTWARASYDQTKNGWQSDGIYAVETAARREIRLSSFGTAPVWSPDGRLIAFDGLTHKGIWLARFVPAQVISAAGRDPDVGRYWWWQWAVADLSEPTTTPESLWLGHYSWAIEKGLVKPGVREIQWEPAPPEHPDPVITLEEALRVAQEFFRHHWGRCGLDGYDRIDETSPGPASVLMLGRGKQGQDYLAWRLFVLPGPREDLVAAYFATGEGPARYGTITRSLCPMGEVWVNAENGTILSARSGAWLPPDSPDWGPPG